MRTYTLAIDPGPAESAFVLAANVDHLPIRIGKIPNGALLAELDDICAAFGACVAIEMVASYGMPVGAEVFDTCVWIGRYLERCSSSQTPPVLVYRREVKLHHCGTARANDANITQALIDRFAPGAPNRGKGTKAKPGWFHGFKADIWQAYALAVYVADQAGVS